MEENSDEFVKRLETKLKPGKSIASQATDALTMLKKISDNQAEISRIRMKERRMILSTIGKVCLFFGCVAYLCFMGSIGKISLIEQWPILILMIGTVLSV
jgi:hypothetical protein